jgi:hypothetical protein
MRTSSPREAIRKDFASQCGVPGPSYKTPPNLPKNSSVTKICRIKIPIVGAAFLPSHRALIHSVGALKALPSEKGQFSER